MSDLEDLLEALKKHVEKNDGESMPSIAEISIRKEHLKYQLANDTRKIKKGKSLFLFMVNSALITEMNIYNFLGRALQGMDVDDNIEKLKEGTDNMLEQFEEMAKDLKKLLEDK